MGMHRIILQRLDDAARWTGIPNLIEGAPRRRPLKWPPVIALLMASAGLIVSFLDHSSFWVGFALLMFGFAIANFMPIYGPLRPWGSLELVDERDRALRRAAFLCAFAVISAVALLGLWLLIAFAALQGWNVNELMRAMLMLAFYLMVLFSAVPTLYASWAMRPLNDTGEE